VESSPGLVIWPVSVLQFSRLLLVGSLCFRSTKQIEREKKYQDVLDLNGKEYDEAQLLLAQRFNQYRTCWFHYLDLLNMCNGKLMDSPEPINHTKLLRKSGFKFKHFV
jgi:hypothetical protein